LRQPVLYAVESWRRQRLFVLILAVAGVVSLWLSYQQQRSLTIFDRVALFAYIPLAVVLGGWLLYCRWRSFVQTTARGLKVSTPRGGLTIEYDQIRWAKVFPLDNHFQAADRRRLIRPAYRLLLKQPALYVKLRVDEEELQRLSKRLGGRLLDGDLLAAPVPNPEAMSSDLTGRLPDRGAVNLGGQRRGRRNRR
jgi:4-amino-4-deoxy-L-arabinose transferase-like glycosyltransferase